MNDRISKQRELIAKKEGKFYTNTKDFQDRIKALPFEAGQNVWLQNSDSWKCEEAVICEKCREPNSYMVEIPATGQCFRRNSNFIKPRQTDKKSDSTDSQPTTSLPGIPQESPVPSSQQFQVAQLPVQWKPFPQYPLQCRKKILHLELPDNPGHPEEVPKEFHPRDLDYRNDIRIQTSLFQKGRCCDMGQNNTINKIELNPSFVLSSHETNYKNDIQLFHQLFDELRVNRDCH